MKIKCTKVDSLTLNYSFLSVNYFESRPLQDANGRLANGCQFTLPFIHTLSEAAQLAEDFRDCARVLDEWIEEDFIPKTECIDKFV